MNYSGAQELIEAVLKIVSRGNAAEVKREKDHIVVVEIDRHVKQKFDGIISKAE